MWSGVQEPLCAPSTHQTNSPAPPPPPFRLRVPTCAGHPTTKHRLRARAPADRAVLAPPRLLVHHLSSAQDVLQRVGHRLRQWRLAARRLGRQELRLRVPGRQRRRRPLALQAGHLWLGGRAQGGAAGLELRLEEASYAGGCVSPLGARAGSASQDGLVC